ncbi:hypothetical protein L596_028153 [Steinernema carpocapsae]|uniref:Delta-like protein n=1 Tax=Steinernema carpocapsae TaxID=34508 RepID=A0A4U5LXN3_STECR|nr:hypothetical protein L596_028153 [Steinernema carpocapsae]
MEKAKARFNVKMVAEIVSKQTGNVVHRLEKRMQIFPRNSSILKINENIQGSQLGMDFTVSCQDGFFGSDCTRFCRNDSRSTCDSEGNRVCRKGWSGHSCHTPVCAQDCHHGVCDAPNTCRCKAGWTGPQCTTCIKHPKCKNGMCKSDANGTHPLTCECEENWGGVWCEKDLDQCKRLKPCQNGAKCTTNGLRDFYVCNCTAGFEGKNCEIPVFRVPRDDEKCAGVDCVPNESCVEGRCQRPAIRLPFGEDVCRFDGNPKANGAKWTTMDCRQCVCKEGKVECSESHCEPRDCVRHYNICPYHQTCVGVENPSCLKGFCPTQVGFCKPWSHTSTDRLKANCDHKRESEECSRFFLEFDFDLLQPDTTVDEVCHHLALTLFAEKLMNYAFACSKTGDRRVQVNMMSVQRDFHIGKVKKGLVNNLRHNATVSTILQAVLRVVEFDGEELMAWERKSQGTVEEDVTSTKILIAIVALLLCVIAALAVLATKQSRLAAAADAEMNPEPNNLEIQEAFLAEGKDCESKFRESKSSSRKLPSRCPTPPPDYDSLPSANFDASSASPEDLV